MGYYAIEERTLQDIADAIRFKDGTTDLIDGWDLGLRVRSLENNGSQSNGDDFSPNNTSTAKYVCDESTLQDIADAIRYLEDTSDPIPVSEMAQRIAYLDLSLKFLWATNSQNFGDALYYANGVWMTHDGYWIYYSDDGGESWAVTLPEGCEEVYSVVYGNGTWLASVGKEYDNGSETYIESFLATSTDGIWWTVNDSPLFSYDKIFYVNGYIFKTDLSYSTNGASWTAAVGFTGRTAYDIYYHNGIWVVGSKYGLYYSIDGKTWTQSNITSGSFNSVYYGNGIWVAGGAGGLYYSADGKTWTQSNITSGSFNSVYYGNGNWVACRSFDGGLYYSADGKTWTQSNITSGSFNSVYYGNGIWVAGGAGGLCYSTDGKTWTRCSGDASSHITTVKYADGAWVAVGKYDLYYSN